MAYLCLKCGEIYREEFRYCPKISCYGKVVNLDELMVPIIKELNNRKWKTLYSCSGHIWEKDEACPYVAFDINKEDAEQFLITFEKLPEPWWIDYQPEALLPYIIRAKLVHTNELDKYKEICEANYKLFNFVKSMDELCSSNLQT